MNPHFWYRTSAGTFRIERTAEGWRPRFEDEVLMGIYPTPESVLQDLIGGHTDWPSCGDPALFHLPDALHEWNWAISSR